MPKAAIIGGGVIGGGWAARFLLNGWNVSVFDPDPQAQRKVGEVLDQARWALPMLYDRTLPAEGKLHFADSLEDAVDEAAFVQESVPERLDLKRGIYAQIEAANSTAPIGSSTSGFKPSELRAGMSFGGRLVVAHPFNPVYLLPVVEVVSGSEASHDHVAATTEILGSIGMHPIEIKKEIDGHVADRLLEAVWREALWLINDGIATTEEIDDAIRFGFGLRWAQMGLFETYRIAGGEGGMAHFIAQFGPALKWPWTKLMDVPELSEALIEAISEQSDSQSGHMTIRELERLRDSNLVAMMRALKLRGSAAGKLIAEHEVSLPKPASKERSLTTVHRVIPIDWTDYNGHMNESRYGQVFSDAADETMAQIGADADYIASGFSYFTVETTVKYLLETHAGEMIGVETLIKEGQGKKLRLSHQMTRHDDGEVLATCDQLLLHVSLNTRRTCDPQPEIQVKLAEFVARYGGAK